MPYHGERSFAMSNWVHKAFKKNSLADQALLHN